MKVPHHSLQYLNWSSVFSRRDFSYSGLKKKSQYKGHTSTEEKTKSAVGEPIQREVTYTMNYIDSAPSSLQQTLLLIRLIVQPDSALTEKSLLDITPNLKELKPLLCWKEAAVAYISQWLIIHLFLASAIISMYRSHCKQTDGIFTFPNNTQKSRSYTVLKTFFSYSFPVNSASQDFFLT